MSSQNSHHKIVIVGGGSAGISVAARLLNAGEKDVAVIDPAEVHYYQPLWTLVGGGRARAGQSARAEAAVMPPDATWIREAATEIDPDAQTVGLASGTSVGYDFLVVCPGLALDWDRLPGAAQTLGEGGAAIRKQAPVVVSNLRAAGGVRLHDDTAPHHSLHQHQEGALRHVAAQAVRAPVHVLEPDAQGPGLSPRPRPGGAC